MSAQLHALDAEPLGAGIREAIEQVSALSEAGDLSSIAIAYVYRDGSVGGINSVPPSRPLLVGAVAYLQQALIERAA